LPSTVPEGNTTPQAVGKPEEEIKKKESSEDTAFETRKPSNAILNAQVVDAETGESIPEFLTLAGVNRLVGLGWQWQPHTAQEFTNGELIWPPPGKRSYQTQVLRIEADGYVSFQTPVLRRLSKEEVAVPAGATTGLDGKLIPNLLQARPGEPTSLKIRLRRDKGVNGRVFSPTGEPVADAHVAIGMANDQIVHLRDGKINLPGPYPGGRKQPLWPKAYRITKTRKDGRFTLPQEIQTAAVVVAHPLGVAVVSYSKFHKSREITLQSWGRIDGQVLWGNKPGAGETVTLIAHGGQPDKNFDPMFMVSAFQEAVADKEGRFVFEFVPPGRAQISRNNSPPPSQHLDVLAGSSTKFVLGGRGRPVLGKLVGRNSWDNMRIRIAPNAPRPGAMGTKYDPWPAYGAFLSSAAGKNYVKNEIRVKNNGTFRIENVPPADYQLFVRELTDGGKRAYVGGTKFEVETILGGESDEPLDIGDVKVKPRKDEKRDKANATGSILRGHITDETGNPLPDVQIVLYGERTKSTPVLRSSTGTP